MSKTVENNYQDEHKWVENPRKAIGQTVIIAAIIIATIALDHAITGFLAQHGYEQNPLSWAGPLALSFGIVMLFGNAAWRAIGWFARRRGLYALRYWHVVNFWIGNTLSLAFEILIGGAFLIAINPALVELFAGL